MEDAIAEEVLKETGLWEDDEDESSS